jgi:hypothetical protein
LVKRLLILVLSLHIYIKLNHGPFDIIHRAEDVICDVACPMSLILGESDATTYRTVCTHPG